MEYRMDGSRNGAGYHFYVFRGYKVAVWQAETGFTGEMSVGSRDGGEVYGWEWIRERVAGVECFG